jgi:protein-disulfide isomerase
MNERPTARAWLRAGKVVASALATGAGGVRRRSRALPALAALLVAGGGAFAYAASEPAPVAPADRAAIEAVVRDYILANPEIIPEAIERLQAKQAAAKIGAQRAALETPYKGAWEGAAQPRVTLVAFMDYACGYCRAALPDIARLVKENPDLRVVYHELPIITQGSVGAAKVSLLAAETGRFMPFHKAMYAAGGVDAEAVVKAARDAGIDPAKARAAMRSEAGDRPIMESIRLAQALGAEGTPLFIVGDQMFNGAVGFETLHAAVDKARPQG